MMRKTLIERFNSKVKIDHDTGCHEWVDGRSPTGNGKFKHKGKHLRAHRVAYEMHKGPIPEGMFICHRCDNPSCVNIDHLFLGTPQDNLDDCVRKGRLKPRKGEAHPHAILTEDDVRAIRDLRGTMLQREIAQKFGVHRVTVIDILVGRSWKHVT